MFILTYLSYGSIHVYREFWSLSKPEIEDNTGKYHSSKQLLSDVDTMNFMVYGLAQFITGAMGDEFPLRIILPISYLIQSITYAMIAFTGFRGGDLAYVQFFAWFSILGLVQSICFPAFVSIVANWFSKSKRGLAVGGFTTCVNIGNILGTQVGSRLLQKFSGNWQWLFVIMAGIALILSVVLRLFLVPHPEEVGYLVEDQEVDEKINEKLDVMIKHSNAQ